MSKPSPRAASALKTALGALALGAALALAGPAHAARVKDIASFEGVRSNPLVGYGLIVGLDGTGDQTTQTPFTTQTLTNMLSQMGVNMPPGGTQMQMKNVAAVMVTAQLPAFARPGQPIDVEVASMGNAKSLKGGMLMMTPLKGADGRTYALAQGQVAISGAGAQAGGSRAQVNHLNAGRIPGGALVEVSAPAPDIGAGGTISVQLRQADMGAAKKVEQAINAKYGGVARARGPREVAVALPAGEDWVSFSAKVGEVDVTMPAPAARVTINSRTGSIVMGEAVTIGPCAIAHGNLQVTVSAQNAVSQPEALSGGQTAAVSNAQIEIKQEGGALAHIKGQAKLADVARALNTLGASPQDLIAILQAMQDAGALRAEIEVI